MTEGPAKGRARHSASTHASCLNFSGQVPPEVKAMLKAVHQFGLVGGEDYDSKVAWIRKAELSPNLPLID